MPAPETAAADKQQLCGFAKQTAAHRDKLVVAIVSQLSALVQAEREQAPVVCVQGRARALSSAAGPLADGPLAPPAPIASE